MLLAVSRSRKSLAGRDAFFGAAELAGTDLERSSRLSPSPASAEGPEGRELGWEIPGQGSPGAAPCLPGGDTSSGGLALGGVDHPGEGHLPNSTLAGTAIAHQRPPSSHPAAPCTFPVPAAEPPARQEGTKGQRAATRHPPARQSPSTPLHRPPGPFFIPWRGSHHAMPRVPPRSPQPPPERAARGGAGHPPRAAKILQLKQERVPCWLKTRTAPRHCPGGVWTSSPRLPPAQLRAFVRLPPAPAAARGNQRRSRGEQEPDFCPRRNPTPRAMNEMAAQEGRGAAPGAVGGEPSCPEPTPAKLRGAPAAPGPPNKARWRRCRPRSERRPVPVPGTRPPPRCPPAPNPPVPRPRLPPHSPRSRRRAPAARRPRSRRRRRPGSGGRAPGAHRDRPGEEPRGRGTGGARRRRTDTRLLSCPGAAGTKSGSRGPGEEPRRLGRRLRDSAEPLRSPGSSPRCQEHAACRQWGGGTEGSPTTQGPSEHPAPSGKVPAEGCGLADGAGGDLGDLFQPLSLCAPSTRSQDNVHFGQKNLPDGASTLLQPQPGAAATG